MSSCECVCVCAHINPPVWPVPHNGDMSRQVPQLQQHNCEETRSEAEPESLWDILLFTNLSNC